jgi:2-alkenal reductase
VRGIDPQTGEIGDVIVAVNDKPVRRLSDLIQALEETGVGQNIQLAVERHGRTMTLLVNVADTGRALR